ncbi:GRAM domain-containing protein 1B isoform X4 [Lates japonicus]|uniref:GRAM domain-containing protein 1B isoform X4 n=1 Tax=Lates japonicus TaxID=270547 RepID=A0AAD3RGZ3_LATJO|nr:GRAM domain-containing protein 1B isoform X4 [Lates japonicus]
MELDEDCTMSDWEAVLELDEALAGWFLQGPARGEWGWEWGWAASDLQDPEWDNEDVPAVLSPTYKQRNEDFRKLFKQLPDTERLIVGEWTP